MQREKQINLHKLIDVIIENAKRIVDSGVESESTYKAWYQHAESAFKKVFGDDWQAYIFWEGYKSESSYEADLKRLANAACFIENSLPILQERISGSDGSSVNQRVLLDTLITNARQIVRSRVESEATYKAWYQHAESALQKALGDDWQAYILWQGYKSESSYEADLKRLANAAGFIESGKALVCQLNVEKQQEITTIKPKEEDKVKQQDLRVFIVHGHDDVTKLELKNYLQNTLKLPEPIILHEQPNHGRAIIEKFERFANESTFAFVLLTPDDAMAHELGSESKVYRARQNVIFEMGYFLGMFGRKAGRVILLYKGTLDIPSDISGVIYIDISNGVESAGEKIRRELANFL